MYQGIFTKRYVMNIKILLVDDNEDLLKITQIILKAHGHQSVLATSIEEAERKIRIHQPALMLLDVSICQQNDGRIFCARLKKSARANDMRIILMSGSDYKEEELNGADDFLPKPFDYNELIYKVEAQLAAAHLMPEEALH